MAVTWLCTYIATLFTDIGYIFTNVSNGCDKNWIRELIKMSQTLLMFSLMLQPLLIQYVSNGCDKIAVSLTTYLYLVPGSSPVKVKISLPSKIMAFSQGTSFPLGFVKTFSWTYIKLPPVMPGNWTWMVVGVIWRNCKLDVASSFCATIRSVSLFRRSSDSSSSSGGSIEAQTTNTQQSLFEFGDGRSSHKGSLARNPGKKWVRCALVFWLQFHGSFSDK